MEKVICQNPECRKEFVAKGSDIKRGHGKFCSRSCSTKFANKKFSDPIKKFMYYAFLQGMTITEIAGKTKSCKSYVSRVISGYIGAGKKEVSIFEPEDIRSMTITEDHYGIEKIK